MLLFVWLFAPSRIYLMDHSKRKDLIDCSLELCLAKLVTLVSRAELEKCKLFKVQRKFAKLCNFFSPKMSQPDQKCCGMRYMPYQGFPKSALQTWSGCDTRTSRTQSQRSVLSAAEKQNDWQCSTMQCSAVRCSAVWCSVVQCSAVQCRLLFDFSQTQYSD